MIRVFRTQDAYVAFMTSLPLVQGEVFCTTFLPSAVFPKHSISLFFSRVERPHQPEVAAQALWNYGRRVRRAVIERKATLCIEVPCLREVCKTGTIHEASPQFAITYPTRLAIFKSLGDLNRKGSIFITPCPLPFVFRLHPPKGVLIDVQRNVADQLIQGIWLEDDKAFAIFTVETQRLIQAARKCGTGDALDRDIKAAVQRIQSGERYEWPW